jgi:hypothetical protein
MCDLMREREQSSCRKIDAIYQKYKDCSTCGRVVHMVTSSNLPCRERERVCGGRERKKNTNLINDLFKIQMPVKGRHGTRHDDTLHNATQHNDAQYNEIRRKVLNFLLLLKLLFSLLFC